MSAPLGAAGSAAGASSFSAAASGAGAGAAALAAFAAAASPLPPPHSDPQVLATIALTSTLASILTHAVITGKVVLPPGLSNLGALFARILPGSDYRRTGSADTEHRSDWTWAQPHRREGTPRGISGTAGAGAVSTPSTYGT